MQGIVDNLVLIHSIDIKNVFHDNIDSGEETLLNTGVNDVVYEKYFKPVGYNFVK